MIRVLLVDDHSVVREGLRMFPGRDPDLDVMGEAAEGSEAIQLAQQLQPDVVLMDLLMPGMDGIIAVKMHIRHILAKLGVQSRTQAVLTATRSGLIALDNEKH